MKRIGLTLIILLISVITIFVYTNRSSSGNYSTSYNNPYNSDDEIITAAKKDLNKFLNLIPAGVEKLYGFENREDFLRAQIGAPFRMYSLNTGFLNNLKSDLKEFIYPVDEWRVPVLIDDKMVSLLTVVKENESYKCVDIGGSALASELNQYEIFYDKNSDLRALLRLYQIHCDILIISGKNRNITEGNCYSLSYTKKIFEEYTGSEPASCKFDSFSPFIKSIYLKSLNIK